MQNGDGGEFAHYVGGKDGSFRQVTRFEDGVDFAAFGPDRALYLVSERNAPRRQILKLAPGVTDLAKAQTLVPATEDAIPISFFGEDPLCFVGDRLYVRYLAGGPSRLRAFSLDGKPAGDVPLPEVASVDEFEPVGADLAYNVETYLTPGRFYRLSRGQSIRPHSRLPARSSSTTSRWCASSPRRGMAHGCRSTSSARRDCASTAAIRRCSTATAATASTRHPASRAACVASGSTPAACTRSPTSAAAASTARRGISTASSPTSRTCSTISSRRPNCWCKEKYTNPARLAIRGGSNGGLLVGAALTQRPELFRAVVAQVAMLDMLRFEIDPNGVFNVTEFGSVKDPAQFRALFAYSPYQNVRAGTKYPAVFFSTGENDGRVNPMNSRKMTARLQAATTSGLPIFLITTDAAGHGLGSPLSVQIDQMADYTAFLFDQLGMTLP